jgi:hypothetical protein
MWGRHGIDGGCVPDCYIIGLILLGSVLVYVGQKLRYIDALFLAAGACTQSGLNTCVSQFPRLVQSMLNLFQCRFKQNQYIPTSSSLCASHADHSNLHQHVRGRHSAPMVRKTVPEHWYVARNVVTHGPAR